MTISTGWSRERIEQTAAKICNPEAIEKSLSLGREASPQAIRDILYKAGTMVGLGSEETAALIQVKDPQLREEILATARQVHDRAYSRRIGIMAPVCPTNNCIDDCLYCPMRRSNSMLKRSVSRATDVRREVSDLLDEGHRRFILVFGHDRSGMAYICDMMNAAYSAGQGLRQVRRLDLNIDPLNVSELRELKQANFLGVYHVDQETYGLMQYTCLHPPGPKADYALRLTCHDRAFEAGLNDVGLGILLGTGDYNFDLVAVIAHADYLSETYARGPHTITCSRMLPAPGCPVSKEPERQISDDDYIFAVAILRLAAPYTGIIMSTPANPKVRRILYATGISDVTVGTLSYPGVYTEDGDPQAGGQLVIGRPRALETLIYRMCEAGFIPNLCTSCYTRRRREAMKEQGAEVPFSNDFCAPNSLLALKEYLIDFASQGTRATVEHEMQTELARLSPAVRTEVLERMEEIDAGLRDFMSNTPSSPPARLTRAR